MSTEQPNVIKNIIKIRNSQGVTKRALAEYLHINESSYGRLEKGDVALTYNTLADIASFFSMRVVDVITYPDVYVKKEATEEPIEAILQIKLKQEKKDQVLKLVFGENNIEILNK